MRAYLAGWQRALERRNAAAGRARRAGEAQGEQNHGVAPAATGRSRGHFSPQSTAFSQSHAGYLGAMPHHTALPKLAIVSTYVPRRCGLATYTADLRQALAETANDLSTVVVAIDRDDLEYGDEVIATIRQDEVDDYAAVVDRIAAEGVGVVLIQHEYGIFGGPNGAHVLALARALTERHIPYLVTLHTVLSQPSPGQSATLRSLCADAARVTVFTETARRMVIRSNTAAGHQIAVVPHGAPVALRHPVDPATLHPELADLLATLRDKPVLTTFGLLSPGKGIDIAIDALSAVVHKHPRTQYVVAGATHPEVARHSGEAYRDGLGEQVRRLGLAGQVHFLDAFLSEEELSALLHHTTLFVTPYRSPEQICSGALTFGLAAGCPAVSSAYRYAEDMLRYGAGRLVPCGAVDPLADAILELLDDPVAMRQAKAAADSIGARITWPAVAGREATLVREVLAEHAAVRTHAASGVSHPLGVAPALRLEHLARLTDEIGIIQFAEYDEPDPASGYCVDDVARLAIVAVQLMEIGRGGALAERWLRQCVRFMIAAFDHRKGMHNCLTYSGTWCEEPYLGDHVGRAIWALGVVSSSPASPPDVCRAAAALLDELAPMSERVADTGLRAGAYALLGLARADRPAAELAPLVRRLDTALATTIEQGPDWHWFEPVLTYDNARLPQAMIAGARRLGDDDLVTRAVDALDWYARHTGLSSGMLRCVGNRWHHRDEDPKRWADDGDEQPIDAGSCVEAMVGAWEHTRDPRYARMASWAYGWFIGRNRVGARLYVEQSGGCRDGLEPDRANENEGAESTLAYYQALLSLVGAGLAALPDKAAHEVGAERVPAANRSPAVSERPPTVELATAGTATGATDTALQRTRSSAGNAVSVRPAAPTRPANRARTTEGPSDAR
jgi:glycosyltransferase involved in cell wall biosynthesis/DNA gyrase inhibitor GyrI